MNEPEGSPVTPPPPSPERHGRALRVALGISVALNLAVVGLVVGLALHGRPHGHDEMVRAIGFGPFTDALRPTDRHALHEAFRKQNPDFGAERAQMRADSEAILAALRAQPYDPAALDAAMGTMQSHIRQRMALGRSLMESFINALTPANRLAFADRLEAVLRHGTRAGDGPRPAIAAGKSASPPPAAAPAQPAPATGN